MSHDIARISSEKCLHAFLNTCLDIGGPVSKCQFPDDRKLFHSQWAAQSCDSKFAQVVTQDTLQSAGNHNGYLSVATCKSSGGHQSIINIAVVTARILNDMRTKMGDECYGLSSQI